MYKRSSNMWIPEYINESEKRLNKVKTFGGDVCQCFGSWKMKTLNKEKSSHGIMNEWMKLWSNDWSN